MSHALHLSADVAGRGMQLFGAIDAGIRAASAARAEQRATDAEAEAVQDLGVELVRTRRALSSARQESVALGRELASANARADAAEAALAKLLRALHRA